MESITDYLESIDMKKPLIQKVMTLHSFYQSILSENIETIFVSEIVNEDKERIYQNVWFFTRSLICEAKNFISLDDIDIAPLDRIVYFSMKKFDYENSANENSRIYVEFSTNYPAKAQMKASKTNCDNLMKIIRERIIPRIQSNMKL